MNLFDELPEGKRRFGEELGATLWGGTVYERLLTAGDVVHFPEGEAGTHQFRNDTDEPFRLLIGSSKSRLNVAGYPDSGKVFITGPQVRRTRLRDAPELDYWEGEA